MKLPSLQTRTPTRVAISHFPFHWQQPRAYPKSKEVKVMRTQLVVLLLVIIYSCAEASANVTTAKTLKKPSSKYIHGSNVDGQYNARVSNRKLRTQESAALESGNAITEDGEERLPNGAWVSKLAEADQKVWRLRKVDMQLSQANWLRQGKDPAYLFRFFDRLHNTWSKIDSNKKTVQWFRFTKAFREKKGVARFPDYEIYQLLKTKVPEEKLAITFESLKQIPDVKDLAVTMQTYQFRLWISRDESPTTIRKLLGLSHSEGLSSERGPKDEILSAFTKVYSSEK